MLFVCLGNICRSPTAHGVFETMVQRRGLSDVVLVDSCGTGGWHVGEAPDRRACAQASERGYKLDHLRARQLAPDDFDRFDYVMAMDRMNLQDLQALCPPSFDGHLELFLPYGAGQSVDEVPDPFYGADDGFSRVLDMIEAASEGLLAEIIVAHSAR